MRKRVSESNSSAVPSTQSGWLDLERTAAVELSSEDPAYPIEGALRDHGGVGWRAAEPGEQVIRLHFDEPQRLRRIRLLFHEHEVARTQEFVLRSSANFGVSYQEVVRQQYNFSPPGTSSEVEDYALDLPAVTNLELRIVPDVSGKECRASLAEWRLA